MQRTKVEKYIYKVCTKTPSGDFITECDYESPVKFTSQRDQKRLLAELGYPCSVLVLVDTETACYEMPDDEFFAHAVKVQKTENEK